VSPTERTYKERILCVLVHIQQHLDDELSVGELARVAHFSPFHFHRIFRGLVGESVGEHVRRLRLERAAWRLKQTEQPVLNVALEAGYETHEAFTRAFHALFGCPPSEYRRTHRPVAMKPAALANGRAVEAADQRAARIHYRDDQRLDDFEPQPTGELNMDVRIENLPARRVIFIRAVGPYQQAAQQAWQRLCTWAGPRGLFGPQTLALGICHDDPEVTPPDKIRYDAALTIDRPVQPDGDIGVQELPAGAYAVTTHRGPHERLHECWGALAGQWLPASGRRLRSDAPSFEIYHNNPQQTPPDQLVTDVCLPLES
jgi:AraC family transcriptional regulator